MCILEESGPIISNSQDFKQWFLQQSDIHLAHPRDPSRLCQHLPFPNILIVHYHNYFGTWQCWSICIEHISVLRPFFPLNSCVLGTMSRGVEKNHIIIPWICSWWEVKDFIGVNKEFIFPSLFPFDCKNFAQSLQFCCEPQHGLQLVKLLPEGFGWSLS